MKLEKVVSEYIKFKRSMGSEFKVGASILRCFCKVMGTIHIDKIATCPIRSYLDSGNPSSNYWHSRYKTLRLFYRYCIARGYVRSSPLPKNIPKHVDTFIPYIYSPEEYRKILKAIYKYKQVNQQFSCLAYEALIKLLFNTGLRIGEALSLTIKDINFSNNLITIWSTKFFKSRLVPINQPMSNSLLKYWNKERYNVPITGEKAPFFAKFDGNSYSRKSVAHRLHKLCDVLNIKHSDSRYQIRVHDIRHTFAVNRLISWYQTGADLKRLLPYLSTYLGHVNLSATQRYLSMTTELLKEANLKFERYALGEGKHV
jgi:integrase/recombinase XerD